MALAHLRINWQGRSVSLQFHTEKTVMAGHDLPISPLAPGIFPKIGGIRGVELYTKEAGFKYQGRDDLLIALFQPGTTVAGVFTSSKAAAASVGWCKQSVSEGEARALVVTAGNANAYTGQGGEEAVVTMAGALSSKLGCAPEYIQIAQTGVIGQPFPVDVFLDSYQQALAAPAVGFEQAAKAIATTDTFPKASTYMCEVGGVKVTLAGIAKGSGMIAPNMATMLGFIMTDVKLPAETLQSMLKEAVDHSFNAITVDGDTSTNDMVLIFATGAAAHMSVSAEELSAFKDALQALCQDLAQQIVRDGEGASKFISIKVQGAGNGAEAKAVAASIANSPLVKTAIAGEDPNWGRIIMAVGNAPVDLDIEKVRLYFGDMLVAENGAVHPAYEEERGSAYFKNAELDITLDLGQGAAEFTVWTCDLTHGYISINADYRS